MELIKFTIGKQRAVNTEKHVTDTELSADFWSFDILALRKNKLAKYLFIRDYLPNKH